MVSPKREFGDLALYLFVVLWKYCFYLLYCSLLCFLITQRNYKNRNVLLIDQVVHAMFPYFFLSKKCIAKRLSNKWVLAQLRKYPLHLSLHFPVAFLEN